MKPIYTRLLTEALHGLFHAGYLFVNGAIFGAGATAGVALMFMWFGK